VVTSAATATGQVGVSFTYQITGTNTPTSFSATGLPAGLSVNTSTGLISGTPTAASTTNVTVGATNASGSGTALVTITINLATPVISSSTTAAGISGTSFSYQITASNSPTSFSASGLPAGLSVNTATGLISGTPTSAGSSSVSLGATNAGGTGSAVLTLTVTLGKPAITSATALPGQVGVFLSYLITATNAPTSFNATGLPAGLTFSSTNNTISGAPTAAGTTTATLSATNASGTGTASLVFTVLPAVPMITSATGTSGSSGSAYSYQITANNSPTSFSATGLPPGFTINTATGLIAGTPTYQTTWTMTVGATNAGGTGSATVYLDVALGSPGITSSATASGQVGEPFSYQITGGNGPTSFSASGLPSGLSVDAGTGLITGSPGAAGTSVVTLGATNASGTGSMTLTLTITTPAAPVIASATTSNGQVGFAFTYQIAASNLPTSFTATNLPAGLTLGSTGAITGVPQSNGSTSVTIGATNAGGAGTATLVITISPTWPVITSATTASGQTGTAFSFQVSASNSPTSYSATGLPTGLSISTTTGMISGTPGAIGSYAVTLGATNSGGTGNATLELTISSPSPSITSATSVSAQLNSAFTFQITATNAPTSYSATGLPAGLTINTATGAITGTPTTSGTFSVTLGATNALGTGTATLTLTLSAVLPPVITSSANAGTVVGNSFVYQITGTNSPTSYAVTNLPAGLTLNTTTGAITGTLGSIGISAMTITASNSGGSGTSPLTITTVGTAPVITSASTVIVPITFTYQITATNSPTSFSATGLPTGLTIDPTLGAITGSASPGTYSVTITASNASGTGNQILTLDVTLSPPQFSSQTYTASGQVGIPFQTYVTCNTLYATYSASGLPPGLVIGSSTGIVSGTPTTSGTSVVTVTATDSAGSALAQLTLTIATATEPLISSSLALAGQVGTALSYQITASNSPTSFSASTLPPGLSLNASTGLITGTPTTAGITAVTIGASNANGTGTGSLSVDVLPNFVVTFGLTMWLKADTGVSTAAGGGVSQWADQSGLANNAVQAAAANQPIPVASQINGLPVIRFAGPNSLSLPANMMQGAQAGEIIAVVKMASNPNNFNVLWEFGTTGYGSSYYNLGHYDDFGTNDQSASQEPTSETDQYYVYDTSITASGTSTYTYDGLPEWTRTGLAVGFQQYPYIGGSLQGDIVEVALYDRVLSSTEQKAIYGYLSTRYAMPTPFNNLNIPVVPSGSSAAGATSSPFSYQIVASNNPTSYSATNLPAGLTLNASTGLITGTPTAAGTFTVTVTATNAYGTDTTTLTVTVGTGWPWASNPYGDADGDGVPNYEDARPNDPTVGILQVTIAAPANGSTVP
jgi:hypothetical protein